MTNLKLSVMALRQSIRNSERKLAKALRFDVGRYIRGGAVDQEIDQDRSLVHSIDDLIQIDTAMASDAMARVERFTGAEVGTLRAEEGEEMTEAQWEAMQTLFRMERAARGQEKERYLQNRRDILQYVEEGNRELDIQLSEVDTRSEDERIHDAYEASFYKDKNRRGYELVMWLRENAEVLSRNEIVKWSKRLNERRKVEGSNRLSYVLWVAGKLIVEKELSRKGITTKERARAAEEFAKRLKEWNENNLQERFVAHNEMPLQDWQMDVENPLSGKVSFSFRKIEEYCDMSSVFGDRHVAMGFMLSNEEDYQIKEGTEQLSDVLLALIRSEGNKSAAAVMCGLPRSTYRNRLQKALKVVNDRLDEGKITKEEHSLVVSLL